MGKKGGLGRGLDALMSESGAAEHENPNSAFSSGSAGGADLPDGIEMDKQGTLWVDPALLKPNPHQPRQEFSEESLQELADSIREHGIIQPVLIEPAGNGSFYIIAGERRTRAARIAGLEKIPVQLRSYNDEKKLEVALIENIQRSDLNPVEEASAYYKLMELGGLSQDDVAKRVGKKRSTVANALRLLKLPEDMQSSLAAGQITAGHARALLAVLNPADQRVLFGRIVGNGLSVREAEQLANDYNSGSRASERKTGKKDSVPVRDPDIAGIEQKFIETLGTKVTLKGDLNRGILQIDYFSRDDLDRLYNLIVR